MRKTERGGGGFRERTGSKDEEEQDIVRWSEVNLL